MRTRLDKVLLFRCYGGGPQIRLAEAPTVADNRNIIGQDLRPLVTVACVRVGGLVDKQVAQIVQHAKLNFHIKLDFQPTLRL